MYIHTDLFVAQSPKKPGDSCGDAWGAFRDEQSTVVVLADGLGSGIRAHIAANMCISRVVGLIQGGMTMREAFFAVADTMDKVWGTGDPFSVFTVARILNNGQTTVLSYEMPPPLQINKNYAQVMRDRVYTREKAIIHESGCVIEKGEGLVLLSDGITQAGIGKLFPMGWEADGVRQFLQVRLPVEQLDGAALANEIHNQARKYWPVGKGDDCSVVLALNRRGITVNMMSGPVLQKENDSAWVESFIHTEGIHVISGGSTALIAARVLKRRIEVMDSESAITPPAYKLDGVELVTEGMITLNQVYHLLEEDPSGYPEGSPASALANILKMADRLNLWLGKAENLNEGSIEFRQQGLLNRKKIMMKIISRLREQGKLVVVREE